MARVVDQAFGAFAEEAGDRVAALYEPLGALIVRTDVASAEMIKLASNAALMTRISFINEIANVCELVGADVEEVARGIGLDRRLGPHFLRAGIGYGGSCFPKDASALKQLAANSGYHFQLLAAVIEVNELQKRRVVQKLQTHLGSLRGKTVALLGLAFKPHTNDMREAPSLVLAPRLLAEGAVVRAWDPVALDEARTLLGGVTFAETLHEAIAGADHEVLTIMNIFWVPTPCETMQQQLDAGVRIRAVLDRPCLENDPHREWVAAYEDAPGFEARVVDRLDLMFTLVDRRITFLNLVIPEIDMPGSRVESLRIRHAGLGQTFHDAFERLWRRGVPFGRALEGDGGPAPDGATIKPRGTGELRSRGQGGRSAEDD